jgi:AraC family transcriptional regulator
MPDFEVQVLLQTPLVEVRDVLCDGTCRHKGEVERSARTTLAFPYRGTYVRHADSNEAVADASQVLFFNAGEDYQVSHPNPGGDATLTLTVDPRLLREIAPAELLHAGEPLRFRLPQHRHQHLVLARDLARRWTLAEVAAEVGVSPVYLTQSFRDVEGVPLYRYQLRLRLARALDLLRDIGDLTELGLHLGFSSHSHFTEAFRQAYGRTPSEFRQAALRR